MHWVKATAPDGRPAYLNLAAVQSMMRHENLTLCFLGGVTVIERDGQQVVHHANTQVVETPAALLNLPKLEPGSVPEEAAAPKPSLPRSVTAPITGARRVDHVQARKAKKARA